MTGSGLCDDALNFMGRLLVIRIKTDQNRPELKLSARNWDFRECQLICIITVIMQTWFIG